MFKTESRNPATYESEKITPTVSEKTVQSQHFSSPIARIESVSPADLTAAVQDDLACYASISEKCNIGATMKIPISGGWVFASILSIRTREAGQALELAMTFVGAIQDGVFARGVDTFPAVHAPVYLASDEDQRHLYQQSGHDCIRIGTVYPSPDVPAMLNIEKLLSRHFSVLGSTGSGKSCTLALMIHKLVESCPQAHVLILDPHNEYAKSFETMGEHFNTENLSLPYWLMNFEEHIEIFVGRELTDRDSDIDILKRCLFSARKASAAEHSLSRLTVDTPIPYKLTDLLRALEEEIGRLEKAENTQPYLRLKAKIEELRSDRRFAFMFSGLLVQDSLHDLVSRLLRFPVEGRPVSTLDLSGIPSEIVDVVVSLISRLVFDFSMWSRKAGASTPLLLVCEEAHRYVPHHSSGDKRLQSARKSLERIAKEGRKYGVSLGLVSQRPSDLSEAILSQCGTVISMRMNNERDRKFVENTMPEGASHFLRLLPSLQNQECLVSGEGSACPLRVRLDYLDIPYQPASNDLDFASLWRHDLPDTHNTIHQTLRAWRRGIR
ncbi:DUF87 domain-containing protein [Temperatibacter marinus]|uniref:DUF87 domain-containing protein n=1 Tax=Temperatibacter marinus TaxID=1456591 RepID=A0AA52EJW9_9PROT|nr:DUF87 domain-containing protein [Temperatibacter marinus]WND03386.1 DUF87 domain-containing protein [Temperatibacter marinus]